MTTHIKQRGSKINLLCHSEFGSDAKLSTVLSKIEDVAIKVISAVTNLVDEVTTIYGVETYLITSGLLGVL